jgi:hypothetical protein
LIGNRRIYLVFLLPVLGVAASVIGGWPGGISPDMAATLREASRLRFDGTQSPLLALAWAVPRALMPIAVAVPLAMTLLFGTAALSRYLVLPIMLSTSCVVIVVLGAAVRRVPRLDSAHIASI